VRVANLRGRAVLLVPGGAVDIAAASDGRLSSDVQALYDRWDEVRAWAGAAGPFAPAPYDVADLGPPVPSPRQIFAIGINYHEHADELAATAPAGHPSVFTKFVSSLTGPTGEIELPAGGTTDWEVELVVVIGRPGAAIAEADAWSYVAGVTVGQDLSERTLQLAHAMPQFSIAKSYPRFGPIGPAVVTVDDLEDPDDLALRCAVNGEIVQEARTRQMIFSVPALIREISAVTPVGPGDIVFTGTPGGVGHSRQPPRYLQPGDELVTIIDGVGELRHRFVAAMG
jgi:2-keto-4-pentenoate hydratase/2-oxohepta-3-ene-1,7-dioic acid hydratase in catechol pathway